MRSNQFRSVVEPILNEVFDGVYGLRKDEWKGVFDEINGIKRAYHEVPVLYGMGAAPEMPEGTAVTYQSGGELFVKRFIYRVYGLAYALTQVLVEDGDAVAIGSIYAKQLANALIETKETLTANVLNSAFNPAYLGGDGVALNVSNHPIIGGTFSNLLTIAANLSQTSVEQMCIQIRQAVDNNGRRAKLEPKAIVTAPQNIFQAEVILKSALRAGTANNDINPVKSMGLLSEGQHNVSRLTSPNAWWIKTDVPEGGKIVMRRRLTKSMEGDFETDSMRYKATERYDVGWVDPRWLYGTPGV
jgi:hypothetical protein